MDSTIVIGITGLIASGKSRATEIFQSLGAKVQDSDKVVHALIAGELQDELLKAFGTNDRTEIAKIVYSDKSQLKKLESILHPAVRKKNMEFIAQNSGHVIVLEIPLLFETNAQEICDYTIFVNVSRETLHKRAMLRPNMTIEKLEAILAKQTSIEEKQKLADFVIDNEDTSDTLEQIKKIYKQICVK